MTALTWATHQGHEKVVDVLLKAGANPDIQLHVSMSILILSLNYGNNHNIQEGDTALLKATLRGHKNILKALLHHKANPNITKKVIYI